MPKGRVRDPVILGIVGDSASGKTTLSRGIAQVLGPDRVAVICCDDYHKYSRAERAVNGISPLAPEGNYIDILEQHLELLRERQPILKPVYNHKDGSLDRPQYIEPKPYIIVEGLLGYTTRPMRVCYDVKVYLDPEEDLRIRWKVQRDTAKRGYTKEQVLAELEKRKAFSPRYISPQRTYADIIVNFHPPSDDALESGEHLWVNHILRPTLPHPEWAAMIEPGEYEGVSLQLTRDTDAKPVDVLTIGKITDKVAESLEEALWELIPEASHLRENVGLFTNLDNEKATSHPLALTQLVITYHMVKAALGVHAV